MKLTDVDFAVEASGMVRAFNQAGVLDVSDVHVAQRLCALAGESDERVALAVAVAVRALRAGSVCVDLLSIARVAGHDDLPWPDPADDLHLLLPDPYSFPSNLLIEHLNTDLPGTTVVGGVVSGGRRRGDTRLFRDRDVLTSGLVGVRLPGAHSVSVVSQGCRPIGEPYIVTGADGAVITELGGRPPLHRLREIVLGMAPDEQELVSRGLQIGIVVDEHLAVPGQGDFLIRGLLGADPTTGAIGIGEVVEVGATVQFQVRDAAAADKDLRLAVERAAAELPGPPVGGLLFTCNGRGRRMFGVTDHDASTIEDLLGGIPLAGFFAAGEIGPVAGHNALHGFTASMALFVD